MDFLPTYIYIFFFHFTFLGSSTSIDQIQNNMPVLALLDQPGTMQCPSDLEAALLLLKKVKGKKKKKKEILRFLERIKQTSRSVSFEKYREH